MRLAVVGHVEWVDFVRVGRLPRSGEIVTVAESWAEAAGGGAVAAVELAKLAGQASLFTALGDDDLGRRARDQLERQGLAVHATTVPKPQRRTVTFLEASGERTIVVIGEKLRPRRDDALPWDDLADVDGVYFTGGDPGAVHAARRARVLVATARELETLQKAGVELDALVASATDPSERYERGDLSPPPCLVVRTRGREGGEMEPGGAFPAVEPPAPIADTYGAGDCFAAGLTFALAEGRSPRDAVAFAAARGAAALTRGGGHGG